MDWRRYLKPENWHEAANLFPRLHGADLTALVQDIKANGLQNPIVIFDGKLLDGRNRVLACARAGIKPSFVHKNRVSPLAYVVTENLRRRHLTTDQRAAIAAELVPLFAKEARQRQIDAGKFGVQGGRSNKRKPLAQNW